MAARIGTAGSSIGRKYADAFPDVGTALERYSRVFSAVEVNSSFHRSHRPSTWAKWAECVPERFRFAVRVPKAITHQAKLVDVDALVVAFAEEVRELGGKLAVLLVQLPPKLSLDAEVARHFFATLRNAIDAEIVCEPRNASWFEEGANAMLRELRVARVAADPALSARAASPEGWRGLSYWRLHGTPVIYRSSYDAQALEIWAAQIRAADTNCLEPWCVFDNTAASEATGNALSLMARLRCEPDDAVSLPSAPVNCRAAVYPPSRIPADESTTVSGSSVYGVNVRDWVLFVKGQRRPPVSGLLTAAGLLTVTCSHSRRAKRSYTLFSAEIRRVPQLRARLVCSGIYACKTTNSDRVS